MTRPAWQRRMRWPGRSCGGPFHTARGTVVRDQPWPPGKSHAVGQHGPHRAGAWHRPTLTYEVDDRANRIFIGPNFQTCRRTSRIGRTRGPQWDGTRIQKSAKEATTWMFPQRCLTPRTNLPRRWNRRCLSFPVSEGSTSACAHVNESGNAPPIAAGVTTVLGPAMGARAVADETAALGMLVRGSRRFRPRICIAGGEWCSTG